MLAKIKQLLTYLPKGDFDGNTLHFRLLFALATIIYPTYWLLYNRIPGAVDPLLWRLLVGAVTLTSFAASYVPRLAGARLFYLFLASALSITTHNFIVLYSSDLHPLMISGVLLVVLLVASSFQSRRSLSAFSSYCLVLTLAAPTHENYIERMFLTLGVLLVLALVFLLMNNRLRLISELTEREARFRRLSECSTEGILFLSDGVVVDHNDAAARMTGYQPGELNGKTRPELIVMNQNTDNSAQPWPEKPYEATAYKKNGDTFEVEIYGCSFLWNGENHRVTAVRDISQRKLHERTINDQQRMIAAASKMSALGEMAAGTAHEINNPLTIIGGKAWELQKLAEEGKLTSDKAMAIGSTLEKNVQRISKIVSGLRAFAREGSDETMRPVAIVDLLENSLAFCQTRLKRHGVEMKIGTISPELAFYGRQDQILQVLLSLVNNSIDAVSNLEKRLIEIAARQEGKSVYLSIRDSGPAINKDVAEKMFQPFFSTKPLSHGTGMGLAIAQGIVTEHRGQLIYNNDQPQTEFVIRLPAAVLAREEKTSNSLADAS